ncbi:SpoIIE family protein phosphatase [Nonomuraea sp. K274]|uniref:protein-serine/threonine phosphatase n=1 Tax=Nonomuraea cypriaca TaxID=1187855 RepID=A0A931F7B2_9ACTN|nr:SpoIIE family protein phosphatase [Nonomuraea cypriaca]MBF8194001.1 SpoIIE family protein phosphatase [Nonomuraea cypriaca]
MEVSDSFSTLERYGLSHELVRALFYGLRVGLYIVDDTGRILMVNPYAEQLLDRPAQELIGADSHDLLHRNPDGSMVSRASCRHLAAVESSTSVRTDEAWFTRGDGGLIPLSLMIAPLQLGRDGDMAGVVLFYDLRRHKAVEQEQAAHLSILEQLTGRLSLMAEISTVLASTLEVEEALRRLTRLVVPRLADWAMIDLLGPDDSLRRVAVVSRNARYAAGEGWQRPLSQEQATRSPLVRVLRGAPSVLLSSQDLAKMDEVGICGMQRGLFEKIDATSVIIAPLRTPRRVLGMLTLARSGSSPAYDEADVSLVGDIAGRAGLAVDNAGLFQEQRRIAETMQRHLIAPLPAIEHLELVARYQPAPRGSQVGGDWYDAFPLPGGVTALVIGDVTGHDLQAAAKMSQIRNMLRMAAWAQHTPPSRVVGRLDDALPHITDDLMATLVLALAEQRQDGAWWLRWTSAGHPPPLLVDDDGSTRYLEQGQGLLLGTGLPADRPDAAVPIPSQSTVLFYTDGLIETPGESLEVGMNRLRRHAAALARQQLPYFCDEILARMRHDVIDDIALLALRLAHPA